jgi:ribosomal protein S12 methylthiotransferase
MPIQHASDKILRAMRRSYDRGALQKQIDRLRDAVPTLSLRTTVLVGYPGETEADFEELLDFMEQNRFRHLGGFTYSDEDGTHAVSLEPKLPLEEMEARLDRVMALQGEIAAEDNRERIGQKVKVIIDGPAEGEDHHFVGRTEGDAPEVDGRVLIHGAEDATPGTFREVLITDALDFDLEATWA